MEYNNHDILITPNFISCGNKHFSREFCINELSWPPRKLYRNYAHMTQSEVISAPASTTNKPMKKATNSDRQNSTRSDNPAFTAFEAKRSAIDKRIDAIRAEMVTPPPTA